MINVLQPKPLLFNVVGSNLFPPPNQLTDQLGYSEEFSVRHQLQCCCFDAVDSRTNQIFSCRLFMDVLHQTIFHGKDSEWRAINILLISDSEVTSVFFAGLNEGAEIKFR